MRMVYNQGSNVNRRLAQPAYARNGIKNVDIHCSTGYAILQHVKEFSGEHLEWTDGMLYPVLHRLERLGHTEAQWQTVNTTLRGIWQMLALDPPRLQGA